MSVYTILREMVVSGGMGFGERISEAELARRLDVSRTPVREALFRLEGDGLVQAQGRGIRANVLTAPEVKAVLQARAGLEAWAAEQAARRVAGGEIAPARITEIKATADETDRLTRDGELASAVLANRRFHQQVAALAGNNVIDETLNRWWDQITIATRQGLSAPERITQVNQEHLALIDAVAQGRPTQARAAAETHGLNTFELLTKGQ